MSEAPLILLLQEARRRALRDTARAMNLHKKDARANFLRGRADAYREVSEMIEALAKDEPQAPAAVP